MCVVDGDGAVGLADGDGFAGVVVDIDAFGGGVVDGVDVVGGGAVADENHGGGWMGRLWWVDGGRVRVDVVGAMLDSSVSRECWLVVRKAL